MSALLWIVVLTLSTTALCAWIQRAPAWVGLAVFVGLPLALTAAWPLHPADLSWFSGVKLVSICAGAALAVGMRTPYLRRSRGAARLIVALLVVNIAEAAVAEALQRGFTLNVLAGAVLVTAMPGARAVTSSRAELRYAVSLPLVIGYTLWNFVFVNGHVYPQHTGPYTGFALAHLAAPLLLMRGDPARYLELRLYALAALMIWRVHAPGEPWMLTTPGLYVPPLHDALSVLALLVAVWAALHSARRGDGLIALANARTNPTQPNPTEGLSE